MFWLGKVRFLPYFSLGKVHFFRRFSVEKVDEKFGFLV